MTGRGIDALIPDAFPSAEFPANSPVNARELHASLGLTMDFSDWIKATISRLSLLESRDYSRYTGKTLPNGGRPSIEYLLTQTAAKRIQIASKGEMGDAAREGAVKLHDFIESAPETEDALILRAQQILVARVARAEGLLALQAPKVAIYDAIMSSADLLTIAAVSNLVARPGHPMGEVRLFRFLREQHVLQHNNRPYQEHIDAERFVVRETEWTGSDGTVHVKCQTLVTQKGVEFIRRRLDAARGQRSLLPMRAVAR